MRHGDAELMALAIHAQGHMLVLAGRVPEGLALLDEAMVAVTTAQLSPFVVGIVYCGVILACEEVYELLMLGGHGSSLPQADLSFKCVWAWTPEEVPRPTPLG